MKHFPITPYPSPNFDLRPTGIKIDLIVIHYTDFLTSLEALEHLCDSKSRVSAHYLIDKGGEIYQLVHDNKRAWHAGISSWQGNSNINCRSIGIELDNGGHVHGLPVFPESQLSSLLLLLDHLCSVHTIEKNRIVGHSDVAPQRKKDPGEMFPWATLFKYGYGFQPKPTQKVETLQDIQHTLKDIGYDCPTHGNLDETTKNVILAFQRHFLPHCLSGIPCKKTQEALKNNSKNFY